MSWLVRFMFAFTVLLLEWFHWELDEVYPLSQHETTHPFDCETIDYVATQTAEYIGRSPYKGVVLLNDPKHWNDSIKKASRKACKSADLPFTSVDANVQGSREIFSRLESILCEHLSGTPENK